MIKLLDFAKNFLKQADIKPDSVLADFTMGNGYDTLYLASLVPNGKVYAFDIQTDALINTKARLDKAGLKNVVLIKDSHENAALYIKEPLTAGMFNLGYLPGSDKSVHTMHESTVKAVKEAIRLLKRGGYLVICVYPGHDEGKLEGELLLEMLSHYSKKYFCITHFHILNSPDASFIITIEKYDKQAVPEE
ncbi:MAG: class I SAM-dependent methyltransferase [Clostridia bacterium]|nr:class I SAM-dependent methyltransferase [Clostridia bacterium]MBR4979695.1 class I SAM-dependent methyltransferase [Clostridia bacterium]